MIFLWLLGRHDHIGRGAQAVGTPGPMVSPDIFPLQDGGFSPSLHVRVEEAELRNYRGFFGWYSAIVN